MKIYTSLLYFLFIIFSQYSFAQKQRGLGGDVSLYFNSDQNLGFHYAINYNWMLNKYIGVSVGGMFFHTKLDSPGWWRNNQKVFYSLNNTNVRHFNISSSLFVVYPIIKRTGLYNHSSLFFEPIPIENISLNKTSNDANEERIKTISSTLFSRFSPGIFTEVGMYYNFEKEGNYLKLFCGFGCGWYDVYSAFRHGIIDNQKLSEHITTDNRYYRISIKIIGL